MTPVMFFFQCALGRNAVIEVVLMAMLVPEPAAVAPASASKPAEVADVEADEDKEICRRKFDQVRNNPLVTKTRKVCKTAAEWAAESKRR